MTLLLEMKKGFEKFVLDGYNSFFFFFYFTPRNSGSEEDEEGEEEEYDEEEEGEQVSDLDRALVLSLNTCYHVGLQSESMRNKYLDGIAALFR